MPTEVDVEKDGMPLMLQKCVLGLHATCKQTKMLVVKSEISAAQSIALKPTM
jgi:hypothetical protein